MGSALHRAIFKGDETAVRMILDAGVSPTVRGSYEPSYTPILTASHAGHREIARLLWHKVGPDGRCDSPLYSKRNCLEVAAQNGHADLVADFLDIWDGWPMDEKCGALYAASRERHDNVVSLLLAKVPYEAEPVQTALEAIVRYHSNLWVGAEPISVPEKELRLQRVVCRLIDAGAKPDPIDGNLGRQPPLLHVAAWSGYWVGALQGLLEKGANANVQDKSGKTALHKLFARSSSKTTVALNALLQHGASPELADETGETALHAVAHTGTLEQLQLCLASWRNLDADAAVHLQTHHGESLLHYAAAGGREDIVEFLLSRGLDVNSANANGWTPLICALMPTKVKWIYPDYSLASFLLQHGADAQAETEEGWTALHSLASYCSDRGLFSPEEWEGVAPLVRELISRGAPLDTESSVLRSRSVTPSTLTTNNAWGIRMRWFAQGPGAISSTETATEGILEDRDTTPHMWAFRTGAMQVFKTILAYWAEASEAESLHDER